MSKYNITISVEHIFCVQFLNLSPCYLIIINLYLFQSPLMPIIKQLLVCSSLDEYFATTHNLMDLGIILLLWWKNQSKIRISNTDNSFFIVCHGKPSSTFFCMSICGSRTDTWVSTFQRSSIFTPTFPSSHLTVI